MTGSFSTDNGLIMRHMINSGCGFARVAHFLVADELRKNKLTEVMDEYSYEGYFYAYYAKDATQRKLIEIFCDFLKVALSK